MLLIVALGGGRGLRACTKDLLLVIHLGGRKVRIPRTGNHRN